MHFPIGCDQNDDGAKCKTLYSPVVLRFKTLGPCSSRWQIGVQIDNPHKKCAAMMKELLMQPEEPHLVHTRRDNSIFIHLEEAVPHTFCTV